MRILITGIGGFVGPYLEKELSPTHEVFGLDTTAQSKNVFRCDLTQYSQVKETLSKIKPDAIAHLAALSSVADSWKNPDSIIHVNKTCTENLYKACSDLDIQAKILLISSAEVYAKNQTYPLTELSAIGPDNPYAKSKVAQEEVPKHFPSQHTVIARSFNHTGPGQRDSFVLPSFAKQIIEIEMGTRPSLLVGNLQAKRDFSDVRDVVRAYRMLIEEAADGSVYNICSGTVHTISDLLTMLLAQSKVSVTVQTDPNRMRPSDTPVFWGSYDKIKNDLGWAPQIPLQQTLGDILNFWRAKLST